MKEELISFETAKLAKEKGFQELCYYYYKNGKLIEPSLENGSSTDIEFEVELTELLENRNYKYYNTISVPTQSLLQKWLREEHNIHIDLTTDLYDDLETMCFRGFAILKMKKFKNPLYESYDVFKTYEQALEKGLQEALKLI
jgi:hypothetical protein